MLTPKQIRIFSLFGKNIFAEYTFRELKSLSKENSNSVIQNSLKRFLEYDLITSRKTGVSKLYRINHKNSIAHDYLALGNIEKLPDLARKSISLAIDSVCKEEEFFSLVVFGSYADFTSAKRSDLDIAVFIHNNANKKKIEAALNSASNKTPVEIDFHVIAESEFSEMLNADYENLGKQIARKNLPVYNPSVFYRLIIKNISHGFWPIS